MLAAAFYKIRKHCNTLGLKFFLQIRNKNVIVKSRKIGYHCKEPD